MSAASLFYLGITVLLCVIFAAILVRTYGKKNRQRGEEPKYRMMEDEPPRKSAATRAARSRRAGSKKSR